MAAATNACLLLGKLSSTVDIVAWERERERVLFAFIIYWINVKPTFPFSLGMLPFITVGELGANLPYLDEMVDVFVDS